MFTLQHFLSSTVKFANKMKTAGKLQKEKREMVHVKLYKKLKIA